ncbi:leucine rich repeat protein [Leptospira weilii str. 2006001855]|uniref:Leucine rich repeat protein n=1 Tax=Leptospira weilii str. 2006001855 TaxID=996804 RepID=M6FZR7_9LEPT|nr:leucine rich repeat protein [Leptospira weilii str. 2006001855]
MKHQLIYQDATSNKFWNIEAAGNTFTVTYGKIGTNGQTQTKSFDTEEKCLKEAQKLLSEKLKKGYQSSGETDIAVSTASPKSEEKKPTKNNTETSPTKNAESEQTTDPSLANGAVVEPKSETKNETNQVRSAAISGNGAVVDKTPQTHSKNGIHSIEEKKLKEPIEKTLGLSREDLQIRSNVVPIRPKEEPQPFDLKTRIEKLSILTRGDDYWIEVDWIKQDIPLFMSKQEAHFWFLVFSKMETLSSAAYEEKKNQYRIQKLQSFLSSQTIDGNLSLEKAMTLLEREEDNWKEERIIPPCYITLPFYVLFGLEKTIHFLATYHLKKQYRGTGTYAEGFASLLPILDESERTHCKEWIKLYLKPKELESEEAAIAPFLIAMDLEMKEELLSIVESWKDRKPSHYSNSEYRKNIIFQLGDSEIVKRQLRKIGHLLDSAEEVKRWLSITQYSDLEWVALSIKEVLNGYIDYRDPYKEMLKLFLGIKAPEAARPLLYLYAIPKLAAETKSWFLENPYFAIEGLVPAVLDNDKKISELAIDILQSLFARGYGSVIIQEKEKHSAEIQETIKNEILENSTLTAEPFDDSTTPEWLSDSIQALPKGKAISWVVPEELPPILIQKRKLSAIQVAAVLSELKEKGLEGNSPLLKSLKEQAEQVSLDDFVWKLFEAWISLGAPNKDKWAFTALGRLGGDRIALKLTPLIKVWPGESQHQRAVLGLEILKTIGSDTALMQLNGIAQKVKFKGLKEMANTFMESIAKKKGLKKSELEDRVVPDCGLDEEGKREFDFGPRTFQFVLGPDLKPMVKDEDGKLKDDLPKPNSKDDADLANASLEEWKLMKKQIREIGKIQAQRMEQAMVTGRRWKVEEWEMLLAKHPLMTHIAKTLLWWVCFPDREKSIEVFRLTEERDYADVYDKSLNLQGGAYVGLVHPLLLSQEEKKNWGQLFGDYEIIPPFQQLGRPVYVLSAEDKLKREIPGFTNSKVKAELLVFGLEKMGWSRGAAGDGGGIDEHSIQFFGDDVTAVIRYDGDDLSYGNIGGQDLELEGAYFVKGLREPSCYEDKETKLSLEEINPVAFSETLHSLLQVTGFSYAASNENSLKEAKEILLKSLQTPEKKEEVFDEVDYTEIYNGFSAAWKKLLSDYCGITRSKNHKNIPKVTKLDLGRSDKIVSIQELKFFHKLEELEIDEPVKDASPLAELKSLKKIKLRNWNVKDLTILSSCPQLEEVELDSIQGFESDFDCSDLLSGSNAKISLDLVGTKFERFPAAVTTFQSLTSLSLRACNLSEVSDRIGNLKRLTNLNLSENQLTTLPAGFGRLEQLAELFMNFNQFTTIPESVVSLKNLKIISVLENQISSLPDGIGNLTSLEDLDVSGNQISTVPSSMQNLSSLTKLTLSKNQLSDFPEPVLPLKNLKCLCLRENPISSLPESIGQLVSLKELWLGDTLIDSLPRSVENLTNLKSIGLYKTKLKDIPDFFANMKCLRRISFESKEYERLKKWCESEYSKYMKLLAKDKDSEAATKIKSLFSEKGTDFLKLNQMEIKYKISDVYYRKAEVFAADVYALAAALKNKKIFSIAFQMTTDQYINARIPFNQACYYALTQQKDPMLIAIRKARKLGKKSNEFLSESDFDFYKKDPDFLKAIGKN